MLDTAEFRTIIGKIKDFNTVILLQHQNPDGDALGSSLGLGHFIRHHYPQKRVLGWVSTMPDYLRFLQPLPQATAHDFKGALVIISDTANVSRIDGGNWQAGAFVIKIDHHHQSEAYADLNLNCSHRIANAEIVGALLLTTKMRMPPLAAQALYTGIVSDSNRFLYHRTDAQTLSLAAKLLPLVPDVQLIYNQLYAHSYDLFKLKLAIAQRLKLSSSGLGSIVLTDHDLKQLRTTAQVAKQQIGFFTSIRELKIMLMVVEDKPRQQIKFSLRSKRLNVMSVCRVYGGGGHPLAAAGFLSTWSDLPALMARLATLVAKQ